MQLFARITKVDEQTGKVYGRAVQEMVDRSGEIFDYETSKPNFAKWSEDAAKATDGKSVGNVRAMHGKVAAGKLTEITFNDAEKAIDVCAEVVDPVEREKCLKGVYTGFSIGGRYGKKWPDDVHKGLERYTAEPTEISLVDLPCVPTAQFTVVKADGAEELRKFETTTDDAEAVVKWAESLPDAIHAALMEKIAKRPDVNPKEGEGKYGNVEYADPKNKKYPLDTAKHVKAAWSYIHMPKNAAKYSSEDAGAIKAKIEAAWKDKVDAKGPPEAEKMLADMADRLAKNANAPVLAAAISALIDFKPELEKGLWAVSQFACILEQLACMADGVDWEEEAEGDISGLPAQMRAALKPLAQAFLAMAEEETDEALHGQLNDDAALALSAKGDLAKAMGFGNDEEALTKWRDVFVELNKAQGDLAKVQTELSETRAGLEKAQADLTAAATERDGYAGKLEIVAAELAKVMEQPAKPKGAARVVEKSLGLDTATPPPDNAPVMKADGTIDHMETAVKLAKVSFRNPMNPMRM